MQVQCGCIFIEDLLGYTLSLPPRTQNNWESVDEHPPTPRSQSAIPASIAHGGVKAGCAVVFDLNVSVGSRRGRQLVVLHLAASAASQGP